VEIKPMKTIDSLMPDMKKIYLSEEYLSTNHYKSMGYGCAWIFSKKQKAFFPFDGVLGLIMLIICAKLPFQIFWKSPVKPKKRKGGYLSPPFLKSEQT
jgi:hypothetical protein